MFVNSVTKANFSNKAQLKFNVIEGDPSKIIQEKIFVNYSKINNNWEIRDSKGISTSQEIKLILMDINRNYRTAKRRRRFSNITNSNKSWCYDISAKNLKIWLLQKV